MLDMNKRTNHETYMDILNLPIVNFKIVFLCFRKTYTNLINVIIIKDKWIFDIMKY